MPIYEYAPLSGECKRCLGRFEVYQRMADEKLTQCPDCSQPCERQISAVPLGGKYSTSDAAIANTGLTKFKKVEKGVYERTAGSYGPEVLIRK
jgi:putative FmdB family regulatory protein